MGNTLNNKVILENYNEYFGEIELILEKNEFFPGEQVNGTIKVDLIEEFPDNKLQVCLIGFEDNKFYYCKPSNFIYKIPGHTIINDGNKNFVYKKLLTVLENKNSKTFKKGKYNINFSFLLSKNLYGTFFKAFKKINDYVYVQLDYFIWCGFSTENRQVNFLSKKHYIIIIDKLYEKPTAIHIEEKLKFSIFCCSGPYKIKIFCEIDKNIISVNEKFVIKLYYDNSNNKINIENINLVILQNLKLKDIEKENSSTFDFIIYKEKIPPIKAYTKISPRNPILITVDGKIFSKVENTLNTRVIKSKYYIKIVFKSNLFCNCKSNIFFIPIIIFNDQKGILKNLEETVKNSQKEENSIAVDNFEPNILPVKKKKKKI